jgi:hypothetical protein
LPDPAAAVSVTVLPRRRDPSHPEARLPQPDHRIAEDEARRLWRRAAEMQVAEERALLAAGRTGPAGHGLSLDQVSAAAEGAGIDPDFVRIALAEQRLPDADRIRRDAWTARWLRRILDDRDVIATTRIVAAPPDRVLAAFDATVTGPRTASRSSSASATRCATACSSTAWPAPTHRSPGSWTWPMCAC